MAFDIQVSELAFKGMSALRAFDCRRVATEIEEQLSHEPTVTTRNRKKLSDVSADFEFQSPLWEMRSGDVRVFYDVDESLRTVTVRAIRLKKAGQTTAEVLHEETDD
jgi:mRNA-degrading endonuclease RelE of RelBE toxin-antitoxin system